MRFDIRQVTTSVISNNYDKYHQGNLVNIYNKNAYIVRVRVSKIIIGKNEGIPTDFILLSIYL